jgi:hypothetical protein
VFAVWEGLYCLVLSFRTFTGIATAAKGPLKELWRLLGGVEIKGSGLLVLLN